MTIQRALCFALFWAVGAAHAERLPNIVIVFTDDQGYSDVGCYGAEGFETPNLDQLAAQGMRFTSFYVAQAVCSASRTALLTGCFPNRIGILGALNPRSKNGIHDEETTIAELLKSKGYATGIFGKWHLGHHRKFLPLQHGFDEYLGLPYSNDMWPVGYDGKRRTPDKPGAKPHKAKYAPLRLIDGNETAMEIWTLEVQATLTTRCTERAVSFIERHKDEPFFLYVPHSMPHVPLGVSGKFRGKSEQGMYGDVMMEIDWSVGQISKALEEHGLADDTLVIFTSDNGPWLNYGNHAGSCRPLREGKGTMWEGGCRVPCIMRWPGHIKPGTVTDKIAATVDVLPTLAEITGAPLPEHKIDGVSMLSLMADENGADPRTTYVYYYGKELQAVRDGKWKLHFPHTYRTYERLKPGRDGWPGPTGKGRTGWALFDLEKDVGERRNVADLHPDIVERLRAAGEAHRDELNQNKRTSGRID